MTVPAAIHKGVIEGFYGRPWSHATRLAYAEFLPALGLNTYIYCPKSDPYLRKNWQQPWPDSQRTQLQELASTYRQAGLTFGVGLSPFALYQNYGPDQREQLKRKLAELATLQAPLLALLFDDMPGDMDGLAERQAEIVADVLAWSGAETLLMCPTYYSFDPVLARYFGAMPEAYWADLGKLLPSQVEVMWTGNKVCSDTVTVADITAITTLLGRPVALWDNYPVNDGALRSNFLYTQKLSGREPELATVLSGHFCNPMNQGLMSLPALAGLADVHGCDTAAVDLSAALGAATYQRLQRDKDDFQLLGISGMGAERCLELARIYATLPGAAAAEVAGWLRGEYTFDPSCLTD